MAHKPEIMAPAGDKSSYLAAIAAGADAAYVGLKHFSARMQAHNFSISELAALATLGRQNNMATYVAMNTMLKPGDLDAAGSLIKRLTNTVRPEALIVQDLGFVELAKQAGYKGEIHLSTLANATHPVSLNTAKKLGLNRVVIPRELNLDEVRAMNDACPKGVDLEIFVHGALCHCVSGRCWWSSYMGGKSGLRGRCVQPCRRMYNNPKLPKPERTFSCLDLGLDVLTKPLLQMPRVKAWKIEGRKKGPHYVYYTVKAYQMLRDNPNDAQTKKTAQEFLDYALGRETTHSVFLPQRPFSPVQPSKDTGSGRFIGEVKRDQKRLYFQPREELISGDRIRIGYEDQQGHQVIFVRRKIPKRGRFDLKPGKGCPLPSGTKVFLLDRRESQLIKILKGMEAKLAEIPVPESKAVNFEATMPKGQRLTRQRSFYQTLGRFMPKGKMQGRPALWLERRSLQGVSRHMISKTTWWLPPVIWPEEEKKYRALIKDARRNGATEFVCNAPWQAEFFVDFKQAKLCAGPFCNISNVLELQVLKNLGFASAIVSTELTQEDYLALPQKSPIPLGFVLKGMWPFGISRFESETMKLEEPYKSPMHEVAWVRRYGQNNWIFPGWELDFSQHTKELERVGYRYFITIREPWPKAVPKPKRTSTFNWKLKLL